MSRSRGPHKVCPNPDCHGGGTYKTDVTQCSVCGATLAKKKDPNYNTAVIASVNTNEERGIFMFKRIILPILGIILSIILISFSLTLATVITTVWIALLILSIIFGLGIVGLIVYHAFGEKWNWLKIASRSTWISSLSLFLVIILIGVVSFGFGTIKIAPNQTIIINSEATDTNTDSTAATSIPISIGLDQPSKSWFLAKAGTLISGDVAIFDNDNNSKKTPVYDSKESTADVIYLTSDVYIWAEWGCHIIENANAQDVANIINDKLTNGNFKTVRFFNGYTKLGTNTPTIISEKIDATAIILPIITTK